MKYLRVQRDGPYLEITVTLPQFKLDRGHWQLLGWSWHWERARGAWPESWPELPPVDEVVAPIYVWWALGPLELRRYRWRSKTPQRAGDHRWTPSGV